MADSRFSLQKFLEDQKQEQNKFSSLDNLLSSFNAPLNEPMQSVGKPAEFSTPAVPAITSLAPKIKPSILPEPEKISKIEKPLVSDASASSIDNELEQATKKASEGAGLQLMLEGAARIGNALGGAGFTQFDRSSLPDVNKAFGADLEVLKQKRKQQEETLERQAKELELGTAKEKTDPDSSVSKNMRDLVNDIMAKNGINVKFDEKTSLAQMEKQFPYITQLVQTIEAGKLRAEAQRSSRESKQDIQQDKIYEDALKARERASQSLLKSKAYGFVTKGDQAVSEVQNALANPSSIKDINVLYSYIKAMDPESAVREGELKLLGPEAQNLSQRIKTSLSVLGNRRKLTSDQVKEVLELSQKTRDFYKKAYEKIGDVYQKQLQGWGQRVGDPVRRKILDRSSWDPYFVSREQPVEDLDAAFNSKLKGK
jgi:hypothetical protein